MVKKNNPYKGLHKNAFWKNVIANTEGTINEDIFVPKNVCDNKHKIVTAGSCFAQNIKQKLVEYNLNFFDVEPCPLELSSDHQKLFGYNLFSARYGNIYTTKSLLQITQEAFGINDFSDYVWETGTGRFIDAFRPTIEPGGFQYFDEVLEHRKYHVSKVAQLFSEMNLFIFTMGLTESWRDKKKGTHYALAPGVRGGTYSSDLYEFFNLSVKDIISDFREIRDIIKANNDSCSFLLTVSPVPLIATASGDNVFVSNFYSKSVLRAAAGQLNDEFHDIDYFPSYELICNPWSNKNHFERDFRSVTKESVDKVMNILFESGIFGHTNNISPKILAEVNINHPADISLENKYCDEELLGAFSSNGN